VTIVGADAGLAVSPADDGFHVPTSADPTWIETAWFPLWLPDGGTSVHVRVWFRPNEGIQGGAVSAWRGENRYLAHDGWTEAFAGPPDLRSLTLANGFRLECVEPLTTYRIAHRSEHVELDVTFTALMEANPVAPEESPGMFEGHLEQPGRMVGRIRLRDRWSEVDCGTVRDRSWGPRHMRPGLRLGNAHGTALDGTAFFAYVDPDPMGRDRVTSGYWQLDGRAARIVAGERRTELDGDFPASVVLDVHDALGRHRVLRGECVNRQAVDAGNDLYAVLNLVRWDLGDGRVGWGENHDIWARSDWLAAGRAPLPSR
jgi:hypothetical protein